VRDADAVCLFVQVLFFVPETLRPVFSIPTAAPFFFAPDSRPLERRRSNSFSRLSETPNNFAVSLAVGNGPLMITFLAFIQTSQLNITSLRG
jgi:hypothetical protein